MKDDGGGIFIREGDDLPCLRPNDEYKLSPAWDELARREAAIVQSVRFHHAINVADPRDGKRKKAAFAATKLFSSDYMTAYNYAVEHLEESIKSARENKLIDSVTLSTLKKERLHHSLFDTRSHEGKETKISQALKIINSVGILAMNRVQTYLGELNPLTLMPKDSAINMLCFDLKSLSSVSAKLADGPTQAVAQSALNWIEDHILTLELANDLLRTAVSQISRVTSKLTDHPRSDSPIVSQAEDLLRFSDSRVRLYSLFSQQDLLGEAVELTYDPYVEGSELYHEFGTVRLRKVSLDELVGIMSNTASLLETHDWEDIQRLIDVAAPEMDATARELWAKRMDEITMLSEDLGFCSDYVHAIGFMEPDPSSWDVDLITGKIGNLVHYSIESAKWVTSGGIFDQLREIAELAKKKLELPASAVDIWESAAGRVNQESLRETLLRYITAKTQTDAKTTNPQSPTPEEQVAERLKIYAQERGITQVSVLRFLGHGDNLETRSRTYKATKDHVTEGLAKEEGEEIKKPPEARPHSPRGSKLHNLVNTENKKDRVYGKKGKNKILVPAAHPAYQTFVKLFPRDSREKTTHKVTGISYWKFKSSKQEGISATRAANWICAYLPKQVKRILED